MKQFWIFFILLNIGIFSKAFFLHSRLNESSNLIWAMKKPLMKMAKYSPKSILKDIADEMIDSKANEVYKILSEIMFKKSNLTIKFLAFLFTKVANKIYSGILIIEVQRLSSIKKSLEDNEQVIFLPTHRSYMDFIVLSYICFNYNIGIPATAAAIDFNSMNGIGSLLQKSGAFFIRRHFKNLNEYWTIFRRFIDFLVMNKISLLEFFLEGTRSRSQKFLTPKIGLLSIMLEPFFLSKISDIIIVPISINYDRVLEEELFANELLGVPKPKESTMALLKCVSFLQQKYGKIAVNFGDKISVKQYFEGKVDRRLYVQGPLEQHRANLDARELEEVRVFANDIIHKQKLSFPITVFNLIAMVSNEYLVLNIIDLTIDKLRDEIVFIEKFFPSDLIVFSKNSDLNLETKSVLEIHRNLLEFDTSSQQLKLKINNSVEEFKIDFSKHEFSLESLKEIIPRIMIQMYVNSIIHYVIELCILVKILNVHKAVKKNMLKDYFESLRIYFKHEFTLLHDHDSAFNENFRKISAYCDIDDKQIVKIKQSEFGKLLIFDHLLSPFIQSFLYVLKVISKISQVELIHENDLLKLIQKDIEDDFLRSNDFRFAYSVNLETLKNCLKTLQDCSVIRKFEKDDNIWYSVNINMFINTYKSFNNIIGEENNDCKNLYSKL